jgi:hypothetical protein
MIMNSLMLTNAQIHMLLNALRIASEDGSINMTDNPTVWKNVERLTQTLQRALSKDTQQIIVGHSNDGDHGAE